MTFNPGLIGIVLISLAACDGAASGSPPAEAVGNVDIRGARASTDEDLGSIDFAISGKTVGAGKTQCELSFVASNNSREEVKNLYVEFIVSKASSGAVLREDEPVVVSGRIQPGESKSPFGPSYVDGLSCADVQLKPRDLVKRHCRKNCVPFRYSASGIAGLL